MPDQQKPPEAPKAAPCPIRILVLEDRPDDAELMVRELRRAGFAPAWRRVDNEADYLAFLEPDLHVILADHSMPQFDSLRALHLLQERRWEIPFIIVSGSFGEEHAVKAMQLGATDYLIKDRLARLGPAVKQALEKKRLREEKGRMEQALSHSEERFRAFMDNTPAVAFMKDSEGRLVFLNTSFQRYFQQADDLIGKTDFDCFPSEVATRLREADKAVLASGKPMLLVETVPGVDGSVRHWLVNKFPVTDPAGDRYLGAVAVDITERKLAEEALRESEATTRAIVDHAADGILTTDERGLIESFNPAAAQIFGYTAEEVIGENIRQLIPRPYLPEHESYRSRPGVAQSLNVLSRGREVVGQHKDGRTFPLELAVSEVQREGKQMYVVVVSDITERKAAEEEVGRSRQQLRALAARLESIREEERTRIAREVHDVLGQALTSLKMDLSWINMKTPPDQHWLEDRTVMMSDLIDSTIQTVRRIATDLRPPVLDSLGLAPAIEWQASEFESRTGIACRCTLWKDAAPPAECATALFRIFQETLTNVARHAQATRVEVKLDEEAGFLVLEIEDNGRGIDPSELAQAGSLGILGMKERAALFGGEVKVSGAPGRGTTVRVEIPLPQPSMEKTTAA